MYLEACRFKLYCSNCCNKLDICLKPFPVSPLHTAGFKFHNSPAAIAVIRSTFAVKTFQFHPYIQQGLNFTTVLLQYTTFPVKPFTHTHTHTHIYNRINQPPLKGFEPRTLSWSVQVLYQLSYREIPTSYCQ